MAKLEPETQQKVDQLLLEAKGLYNAIIASKPPASLGYAIRDMTPFEKLDDSAILGAVQIVAEIRKGNAAAAAALEASKTNGSTSAVTVSPSDIVPPKGKRKGADASE